MKTRSDRKFISYFHNDYATVFACPVSEQGYIGLCCLLITFESTT